MHERVLVTELFHCSSLLMMTQKYLTRSAIFCSYDKDDHGIRTTKRVSNIEYTDFEI